MNAGIKSLRDIEGMVLARVKKIHNGDKVVDVQILPAEDGGDVPNVIVTMSEPEPSNSEVIIEWIRNIIVVFYNVYEIVDNKH
ncbi:hypothetical protein [Methylobacterium sp. WSM2598]|uniref:hypothetical protein n=1 Tax=Methylobacterium sp. WSM2598 TaxID=398261 RepID=UPI0012F678B3|nr:hypothetical protein [Methylobacterium sp. WSM2598]